MNNTQLIAIVLLLATWAIVFILYGGLTYRVDDVFLGVEGRPRPLIFVQAITNLMIIFGIASLITPASPGLKSAILTTNLLFLGVLAASGSRGLLALWIVTLFFSTLMNRAGIGFAGDLEISRKQDHLHLIKEIARPKVVVISVFVLSIFAFWGAMRDGYSDVGYSVLLRLAEPYWYFSAGHNADYGHHPSLLIESIWRIITIPQRWAGYEPGYSIEGNEYLLENYLGIKSIAGVSLPITLIGEGFLFFGPVGVFIYLSLGACLIVFGFNTFARLPYAGRQVYLAFMAFLLAKVILAYARSLSGVFLIAWYEPFRDFALVTLILFPLTETNKLSREPK